MSHKRTDAFNLSCVVLNKYW